MGYKTTSIIGNLLDPIETAFEKATIYTTVEGNTVQGDEGAWWGFKHRDTSSCLLCTKEHGILKGLYFGKRNNITKEWIFYSVC